MIYICRIHNVYSICIYICHSISIESISALSTRWSSPSSSPSTSKACDLAPSHRSEQRPGLQLELVAGSNGWMKRFKGRSGNHSFLPLFICRKAGCQRRSYQLFVDFCIYLVFIDVFFFKRIAWSEAIIIGFLLFMRKPFRMETKLKLIERTRNTTKNKKQQKKKDTPRNSVFQTSQHG